MRLSKTDKIERYLIWFADHAPKATAADRAMMRLTARERARRLSRAYPFRGKFGRYLDHEINKLKRRYRK